MNNTGNIRAQEVPALRCGRRSGEDLVMEEGCNMTACFFLCIYLACISMSISAVLQQRFGGHTRSSARPLKKRCRQYLCWGDLRWLVLVFKHHLLVKRENISQYWWYVFACPTPTVPLIVKSQMTHCKLITELNLAINKTQNFEVMR